MRIKEQEEGKMKRGGKESRRKNNHNLAKATIQKFDIRKKNMIYQMLF